MFVFHYKRKHMVSLYLILLVCFCVSCRLHMHIFCPYLISQVGIRTIKLLTQSYLWSRKPNVFCVKHIHTNFTYITHRDKKGYTIDLLKSKENDLISKNLCCVYDNFKTVCCLSKSHGCVCLCCFRPLDYFSFCDL